VLRSTERILTSHTGSLPRPAELIELLSAREQGCLADEAAFHARVQEAVADVVRMQVETGIDIVNDGEAGKPSYASYVKDRLTGFEGESIQGFPPPPWARDFPEYWARLSATNPMAVARPACTGPIAWKDFAAVERDIANLQAAVGSAQPVGVFMTAASPGIVSSYLPNEYFATYDDYLDALAASMRDEYEAIAGVGFALQIDCPDLPSTRQGGLVDLSPAEFPRSVAHRIEVVNEATRNIAPERMRLHLCWGNAEAPHHTDVPLREIVSIVLQARPSVLSFEGANPRHEHEWNVWEDVELPDGKVLMPGVIDSTTNFIEHPELVSQRIQRYTRVVGRERVIAGVDCGFATVFGMTLVDPRVAWAKLRSLVDGAELASKALW
jgi:5-methyltetrahydropteroyltriglutamate--homocysteine methyltransferase